MAEPIAVGLVSPIRTQGTMGFGMLGVIGLVIVLAGALGPDVTFLAIGAGIILLAAAGLAWHWQHAAKSRLVVLYPDRIEWMRGPQKGTLPFADVRGADMLEWSRSTFPYSRGHTVLVLHSGATDWQIGPEVAEYHALHEAVLAGLGDYLRSKNGATAQP